MPFGLPLGLSLGLRIGEIPLKTPERLSWIYGFWKSLAPYAYARIEDEVVILPPNLVYKTNATGARLLDYLSSGGRLEDLPGFDEDRARDVEAFFVSLKAAYDGRPEGLTGIPYDFSFTRLPVLGELALTYRCNNRCRFCYAGCGSAQGSPARDDERTPLPREAGGAELDTAGWKRVIDVFKDEAKIPFFSFTGGEPLLRPDVEELAAYAVSRGLRVNLVTNGRLATPTRAAALYAAGLRTAQVSLEGTRASVHDQLCGAEGAFEDSVAGIRAMLEAGMAVQTNSTLTAANRDNLLELPAFVASLGVRRLSMNLFIPTGTGAANAELLVPYAEAGPFVDEVRARARKAGVEFLWYSPLPMCLYNPIARGLGNKSCAACDGLLSIAPDGGLLPCSSWPEALGNLARDGFKRLWFSEAAAWFKEKRYAPESCRACSSFTACQAACPLYWKGVGYAELENRKEARR